MECSTQFFVLLQPAAWMATKYVAFGQLIEGESVLQKIETVPTWYESPTSEILIHKAGILNMECQHIPVNKGTNEYIHGHIEDLIALGDILIEVSLIVKYTSTYRYIYVLKVICINEFLTFRPKPLIGIYPQSTMNIHVGKLYLMINLPYSRCLVYCV